MFLTVEKLTSKLTSSGYKNDRNAKSTHDNISLQNEFSLFLQNIK